MQWKILDLEAVFCAYVLHRLHCNSLVQQEVCLQTAQLIDQSLDIISLSLEGSLIFLQLIFFLSNFCFSNLKLVLLLFVLNDIGLQLFSFLL